MRGEWLMSRTAIDQARAPRQPQRPAWPHRESAGGVVVFLSGELDLAVADELRRQLMDVVVSTAATTIVLDFSDVTLIDAHSVGVLVAARNTAEGLGRLLLVDGLHGMPARVFALLGLRELLAGEDGAAESPDGVAGLQRTADGRSHEAR
jgi:anti-anti-sigma factor